MLIRTDPVRNGSKFVCCLVVCSVQPRLRGCLEVVTAGVVLQRLQGDPALLSVSHLLLDEVHERDTTVDILLGVVKQVCIYLFCRTQENSKFLGNLLKLENRRLRYVSGASGCSCGITVLDCMHCLS